MVRCVALPISAAPPQLAVRPLGAAKRTAICLVCEHRALGILG